MLDNLLVHPKTQKALTDFVSSPSHAVVLIGATGAGKAALARALAAEILSLDEHSLDNYAHFRQIKREDTKKDIPIEAIREVNKALRLQTPGSALVRRIVLIEGAQRMNEEAQNAFLKSLEEPPADTVFILTATAKGDLLPTIISRAQIINVHRLALADIPNNTDQAVVSAWQLSRGAAGLFRSLLNSDDSELKLAVDQAKDFLRKTPYERLLELDSLSKDKERFNLLLDGLARVIQALYKSAAKKSNKKQVASLLRAMEAVDAARQELEANVLGRLVALRLALNFNV